MEWDIVPWLIKHAANLLSWYRKDNTGRTPYQKTKGRPFNRQTAEFGETVFYLKPKSTATKDNFPKSEQRWEFGTWLGLLHNSNEYLISIGLCLYDVWSGINGSANGSFPKHSSRFGILHATNHAVVTSDNIMIGVQYSSHASKGAT